MARAAGPCRRAVIENGQIIGWEIMKKKRSPAPIRSGKFIVWDDLCETTRYEGSLSQVASYLYYEDDSYCKVLYNDMTDLRPAERKYLRKSLEN